MKRLNILYAIDGQERAIKFWELLVTIINCNSLKKDICFELCFAKELNIKWDFVSNYGYTGIGSIRELEIILHSKNPVEGPDWRDLCHNVKIDQVKDFQKVLNFWNSKVKKSEQVTTEGK